MSRERIANIPGIHTYNCMADSPKVPLNALNTAYERRKPHTDV